MPGHLYLVNDPACSCAVRVYSDGSTPDIEYCPLHDAVGDLLAACKEAIAAYNFAYSSTSATWSGEAVDRMKSAIAKAESE